MMDGHTLRALIHKEFLQVLRDKRMLAVLLVVPVLQVTVFGYAANLELTHVDTVVVDDSHSQEARMLTEALGAEGTFHLRPADGVAEAERALRDGQASLALIVPHDFVRHTRVQALVDGSDPSQAQSVIGAIESFVTERYAPRDRAPALVLEPRFLFNPGMASRLFMVPGTAAAVLVIVTAIVTAMGLTREREVGTLEQLLVTPMSSATLMVGKTIPYALFGLFDEAAILLAGRLLFDVPLRGIGLIFLATAVYVMSTLGIGLFIATVARTQQQALMGGFFFLLPAILLSGFLTSVDAMPAWVQPLTWLDPVLYFIDICRSVLLRGAGLREISASLAWLTILGFAILTAASWRFRKQLG